jgi:membrane-bound lytic murein transglycosylase D
MNIATLIYLQNRRPATWMLLVVALGLGCSHVQTPQGAAQGTIETGASAPTADRPLLGEAASATSAASPSRRVLTAVDPLTIHPLDAFPRGPAPVSPTATDAEMSDFPIVLNARVKAALKHLQTHRSDDIAGAFWRARRYAGMMRAIFREYDLPEDLVNLAFIESDVNPRATSHAQAAGIWQFVPTTARTYGMRTTASLDERRDPDKSTRAAAEHLKSLYRRFQAWPLTLAAYNAGENAVQRAITRQRTRNFWQLRLPRETRQFVPKFMAMSIIARDPRRYGFSPPPEAPHDTEILHISQPTDIRQIAEAAGTTVKHLRELNPELVGPTTPPEQSRYALRIPRRFTWVSHTVQKGETLSAIARRYKVSPQMLREANKFNQSDEPAVGRIILVPAKAPPPPA